MDDRGSALDRLAKELGAFLPSSNNTSNVNISMGGGYVVALVAVCLCIAGVAMTTASRAGDEVEAMRASMERHKAEQAAETRALNGQINAIRAYINTGQMPKKEK